MEVIRESYLLRWLRRVKQLIKLGIFLALCISFLLLFLILYLRSQPMPAATINQTTTIFAQGGEVLDTLHQGENRVVVPINKISPSLVQATIAIEDKGFYAHYGFDLKRLAKVVYINVTSMDKAQGASTITQQLARNLYLTFDKTWERKIKEAILAVQLELNYSKEEILEMYLNQIYYGEAAYGVQAAAQTYFGKDADKLTLAESAAMAGFPKGPSIYNPYTHMDKVKARQKLILQAMQSDGVITAEQAEAAYHENLVFRDKGAQKQVLNAPYFRDYIAALVKSKYGIDEDEFLHGGLKIYTTLDYSMQKKAEESFAKHLPKNNTDLQAALISVEPSTGHIKAYVGGRDYAKSQYDRVFSLRQPGSSFKPFLYLAALQNGFTPLTLMKSEPTVFKYDGKEYIPSNFGDHYANAFIPMQQAIATSDNIYAVKTIEQITPQKVVDEARLLGITSPLQPVPSLALGTSPVSPYEMTTAYSILANNGEKVPMIAITKIEDDKGTVLVEENTAKTPVVDPSSAFILTHMMQGVFEQQGTAYRVANMLNRPVAGKTGSTDYDSWLVGYSPQLVTTVWVGYDEGRKIDPIKDARVAAPLWAGFMESALKDQPPALFDIPARVTSVYVDMETGKLATEHCPAPKLVYFATGTEPQEYCTDHLLNPNEKPKPLTPPEGTSVWQRVRGLWNP